MYTKHVSFCSSGEEKTQLTCVEKSSISIETYQGMCVY